MFSRAMVTAALFSWCWPPSAPAQDEGIPGATEETPSRSEYFTWINNTNEGATEEQTLINLAFFEWLHDEFGMALDIYAFDAGAIDGKRFYGSTGSDRFARQFPNGFDVIYRRAKSQGVRLGVWGGPDGFGESPDDEAARIEQMVSLCRDYDFALFKFDAVCGALRPAKEDAFIKMMRLCRSYSPDLILLNHRLGLARAQAYATTFLWEGKETYVDVFSTNSRTAPHHRADALSRGLPPDLQRLTEDHGVCLSSCLDFWEDDLVLQAFNRSLILAPQLYGNPWLLRDDEFPRLARLFNLHRRYRRLLVSGVRLPEEGFGPFAVSRGDGTTRLVTLRNLTWETVSYELPLDERIGLTTAKAIHCRRFHPSERVYGEVPFGAKVVVDVPPFRSCLVLATSLRCTEPAVTGCDFEVVRNVPGSVAEIRLLGQPGSTARIGLLPGDDRYRRVLLDGRDLPELLAGRTVAIRFPGEPTGEPCHRRLAEMTPCPVPADAEALYEATAFAADSNALEVRSLERSGHSDIPVVKAARRAFFDQPTFRRRGIWDRNLFDGDLQTGFWASRKYGIDQRVEGGCLRLDLGAVTELDQLVLRCPDDFSLQPLLEGEGNQVDVSVDLRRWRRLTYLAGQRMVIDLDGPVRYLRFLSQPSRLVEIEGYKDAASVPRGAWRASNLLAHPNRLKMRRAWHARVRINHFVAASKLCIAIEGVHGVEGAYAALAIGDRRVGCPDRAPSYPSNTWEYVNARRDRGYTYFAPVTREMIGREIDLYVLSCDEDHGDLHPVVWVTAHPEPRTARLLELER